MAVFPALSSSGKPELKAMPFHVALFSLCVSNYIFSRTVVMTFIAHSLRKADCESLEKLEQ